MTATFAALFLAHVLADFVLQPDRMVAAKQHPGWLFLHGATVWGTAVMATGSASAWLLVLAAVHLAIDLGKSFAPRGAGAFLADQGLHLATLAALASWQPGLMAAGLWAGAPLAAPVMALGAGLILATTAGGYMIGLLMAPFAPHAPEGLPRGGRLIGLLERGLIFVLILTGQAAGIGFLIAAKSVLRFSDTKDDRKISEYVIIGTLASVAWAIFAAGLTQFLLNRLPPLGIPDLTP